MQLFIDLVQVIAIAILAYSNYKNAKVNEKLAYTISFINRELTYIYEVMAMTIEHLIPLEEEEDTPVKT